VAKNSTLDLRMTVYCALFTALIIIGAYISVPIPLGPIPIVLTDLFIMLAGLFLGYKYSLISVGLYLGLGLIGLPVFAGGNAGLAVLFGPTGGFLVGYLLLAASAGWIAGKTKPSAVTYVMALAVGNMLMYAVGIPWLKMVTGFTWLTALAAGLTPFIPGAAVKIIVAVALASALLPRFKQTLLAASVQQANGGDD
jgi:biotin transport system substrate-specific component